MSRQSNEPPSVEKPGLIVTKETSSNNNNPSNTNLYPNLNPPSYSQATYATVPPYSSTAQPTTSAPPAPMPTAAPQYVPATQNVIVVQGPAAYYANPRALRLPDGSTPCVQCGTIYPMPAGATTFRCRQCGKFNNTNRDQCIIL